MKPILFNTEMVRAILDRQKTQTRRVVKPQPQSYSFDGRVYIFDESELPKPQYQPGDILWVRETWREEFEYSGTYDRSLFFYKASDPEYTGPWHPSIHMPREAARIFLRVTDVRVERLQDMTDDDVRREGIENPGDFIRLWDSTIKPADRDRYSWAANPWVWVISFERYEPADPEGGEANG